MSQHSKLEMSLACLGVCLGLSGCVTSGHSSSNDPFGPSTAAKPGIMQTISGAASGIGGQIKSMGTAVSGAFTKTKDAVTQTILSPPPTQTPIQPV